MISKEQQLIRLRKALCFIRFLRRKNKLFNHRLILVYLRYIQQALGEVLECQTAFAGSLALFVQGLVERFGDFDVVTDREFLPEELPWEVNSQSEHGLGVWKYDLDIFYNVGKTSILELANKHIVEVHGIRVQSADFVMAINKWWDHPEAKPRLCADSISPEMQAEFERCL